MKKLMIALATVALAVGVQAGTVSWKTGQLYIAKNAEGGWNNASTDNLIMNKGYTIYAAAFYLANAEAYAAAQKMTQADLWTAYGNADDITKIGYEPDGEGGWKVKDGAYVGSGTAGAAQADDTAGKPSTDYYAVVLMTYHDDEIGADFYMASPATGKTNTNGAKSITNIGVGVANWQAVAVPEPTSGLLLLLGVAGLALKRRRV